MNHDTDFDVIEEEILVELSYLNIDREPDPDIVTDHLRRVSLITAGVEPYEAADLNRTPLDLWVRHCLDRSGLDDTQANREELWRTVQISQVAMENPDHARWLHNYLLLLGWPG